MNRVKAIYNGKIITEGEVLLSHAVVFTNKIIAVIPEAELVSYGVVEKIDAGGNYISPGFIDIHIHGCAGADTMDMTDSALDIVRQNLVRGGVTAFLPTTMTMRFDIIEQALTRVRKAMAGGRGAQILGCHLEGPFISEEYKGAQDKQFLLSPDIALIENYLDVIKIVTIAPELPGSFGFIRNIVARGIVASIGHSAATYDQAISAIKSGVSHITHTFNALVGMNHRHPGVVGAVTDSDVTCELIADNIHVHPAVQRLLLKLKGADHLILVSDSMRASLMPDGEYEFGGQQVIVHNHEAHLADGTIAGSVLTLNKAVANFKETSHLPIYDVIKMVTLHPARKLGISHNKGSIAKGKDADLLIFDEKINILSAFVQGERNDK